MDDLPFNTDTSPAFDSEGRPVYRHDKFEGVTIHPGTGEAVALFSNPVAFGGTKTHANEQDLYEIIQMNSAQLADTAKGLFPPVIAQDISDHIAFDKIAMLSLQTFKRANDLPVTTPKVTPDEIKKYYMPFEYCANDSRFEFTDP